MLRGEQAVMLRETSAQWAQEPSPRHHAFCGRGQFDGAAQARFINLKAWRAEGGAGANLPAYVIFTMPRWRPLPRWRPHA